MQGNCPKCNALVTAVHISPVTAAASEDAKAYRAVSFNCRSCNTVLGIQIDPMALNADLVGEITELQGQSVGG